MDRLDDAALMFKALGDPTRLRIFRFLNSGSKEVAIDDDGNVRHVEGPTVGEVCCHITGTDKITSTISFHLKELRICNLITMEKRGRYMVCAANREAAKFLVDFLIGQPDQKQEVCCEPPR
jgi:DNA-binding transcriptional ArsR family regulator